MGAAVPSWWQDWQLFWKIGAMSLLNVGCRLDSLVTSAACTVEMRIAAIPNKLTLRASILRSFYRDLHLDIGPTAVIAKIPGDLSRAVIHHQLQKILSRLTESRARMPVTVLQLGFGRTERNVAGPPK